MPSGSIDLWIIQLDLSRNPIKESLPLLSDDEKARLDRFQFDEDKQRFAVAHASLRRILSRYLPLDPVAIQFEINAHGKPILQYNQTGKNIHFNLSHSADLALVAISSDRPVGVDVEKVKPLTDYFKIAGRYFSPDELDALKHMEASQSHEGFIQLWAGKEALIKARGGGMSLPLNRFSLAGLLDLTGDAACKVVLPDSTIWFVYKTELTTGYLGAVAARGEIRKIKYLKG